MKALLIDPERPGVLCRPDYPDPTPAPGEVLIRVQIAGVCSTDLELARGYMGFHGVPGHEFVGVVETGDQRLVGRRVVAEINCAATQSAIDDPEARKHDPLRTVLGILGRDGAFAERLSVPSGNCHIVPDAISDRAAVFVEPLAAACQILRDERIERRTRVAVLGSGRLGILCAQVLATAAERVEIIGRNARTLEVCRRIGLTARHVDEVGDARDYDLVVECTGAPAGLARALPFVRPRGVIVLKSTYAGAADVDLAPIVIDEIRVHGSRCGPFADALALLERWAVHVEELIDGTYPLERGAQAFAAAAAPGALKVLLDVAGG